MKKRAQFEIFDSVLSSSLETRILKDLAALIFSFHHHPSISSEQFIASCSDPLSLFVVVVVRHHPWYFPP